MKKFALDFKKFDSVYEISPTSEKINYTLAEWKMYLTWVVFAELKTNIEIEWFYISLYYKKGEY